MSKKDVSVQKGIELFHKLAMEDPLRKDIRSCRKEFGIPLEGFETEKELIAWWTNTAVKVYDAFLKQCARLEMQHKLSVYADNILEEYILASLRFPRWDTYGDRFFAEIGSGANEKYYQKIGRPFAKILIFDYASMDDVFSYIKKEWPNIKKMLSGDSKDKIKRLKQTKNRRRDEKVFALYQRAPSELGLENKYRGGGYRDLAVSERLKEEGIILSTDNVRTIVARQKKLRRVTNKGGA